MTEATIGIEVLRGGSRYEPFCDPIGDWLVWDAVQKNVAEIDGNELLIGLTQREALRVSALLNDREGLLGRVHHTDLRGTRETLPLILPSV